MKGGTAQLSIDHSKVEGKKVSSLLQRSHSENRDLEAVNKSAHNSDGFFYKKYLKEEKQTDSNVTLEVVPASNGGSRLKQA